MFSESEISDFISIISLLSDLNNLEKNKHRPNCFLHQARSDSGP